MLEKQNKIIIVDNMPNELDRLGKSFFKNGLGCRTFEYDITYEEPLNRVRIAFFDVNLTEKAVDANYDSNEQILHNNTSVFNDLAIAINQYIAKDNGPYVLIFWTANAKIVEAFKLYMQDPLRGFSDTASPILIDCIDKTQYIEVDKDVEESTLSDRILQLLNSNEKIKFLFDLEENSRIAGENTLNRIYDILPKKDVWGESTILFDDLDKVLSKISASSLGFEHAKENPKKAIYEGLLPIINYEFLQCDSGVNWNNIVNKLSTANSYNELVSPDTEIQNKVNTLYHIEDYLAHTKDVRGAVIEIDSNSQEILNSLNIENSNEWIKKLLAIKEANEDQQKRRDEILKEIKLIAIEISASCDYSNKKTRINKYILGVLTTNLNEDLKKDLNLSSRPESCYHLGGCCFYHNKKNSHIWLNLNYVFGAKPDDTRLTNILFILKKEIMDMLGNKYASHISRIGITSF